MICQKNRGVTELPFSIYFLVKTGKIIKHMTNVHPNVVSTYVDYHKQRHRWHNPRTSTGFRGWSIGTTVSCSKSQSTGRVALPFTRWNNSYAPSHAFTGNFTHGNLKTFMLEKVKVSNLKELIIQILK